MKRNTAKWFAVLVGVVLLSIFGNSVQSADSVEPASVTITNIRSEAVQTISWAGTVYQATSLLFTNCVVYSDTEGSVVQGLNGVTVQVSVGNLSTNVDYNATVMSTNAGTWYCNVTVPSLSSYYVQVKLTDSQTNSYIYPNKTMSASQSMF